MAISAKLELRQGQQLVMTPQLQQAIKLLQFSNLELNQFVDAELERNPLLERDESAETGPAGEEPRTVLASSFGATLEMAREGLIELRQDGPFSPIYMRKREPGSEWEKVG
jgi:RNA polymerase sigma-54 factor